jgi:glycosyltransferase involved in cell wall biosynthesis
MIARSNIQKNPQYKTEQGQTINAGDNQQDNSQVLISVVTVTFNSGLFLEQTIKSVINQTYDNIEYIIIDGASTDGSIEIINKYNDAIDYWVSEPDKGIAHAMNKGIAAATGDYILFLHADDYLLNNQVVQTAVSIMSGRPDIAAFNIIFQRQDNKIECKPRGFNLWLNFKTGIYHQGVLCSKIIFEKLGGFDESYKIAMDYEFWLRAYRQGIRPKIYDFALTYMRDTGISSKNDWPSLRARFLEEERIHYQHATNFIMRLIYNFYWILYIPYRYFTRKY